MVFLGFNGKLSLCLQVLAQLIVCLTIFPGGIEYRLVQSQFSSVSEDELSTLCASDKCIISSTRDRFDVVSLESITCQRDTQGVSLLADFAGSVEILDDCIKFKPWETKNPLK